MYIDEVDGTLSLKNERTNETLIFYGKILTKTANNPKEVEVIMDNLSRQNSFNAYFTNNNTPATLDFSFVNFANSELMKLKDWFYSMDKINLIFVDGKEGISTLTFNCVLMREPMSPSRDNNFQGNLSFKGAEITEDLK